MPLFDHIRPRQLQKMAELLVPSDGSGPVLHRFPLRIWNDQVQECRTGRLLRCLGPLKDRIASLSDCNWMELRVSVCLVDGVQFLSIVDPIGSLDDPMRLPTCMVPKELWEQACLELGLDIPPRQEC